MKHIKFLSLILLITTAACNNGRRPTVKDLDPANPGQPDTAYMRTGFYYLARPGKGVEMHEENTNELFTIERTPFASVDDIVDAKVLKDNYNGQTITAISMIFNAKGARELEEGTGEPAHPKLAVVIANKLIYVVSNSTKVSKGIMNIILDGYAEKDIRAMQRAIKDKK